MFIFNLLKFMLHCLLFENNLSFCIQCLNEVFTEYKELGFVFSTFFLWLYIKWFLVFAVKWKKVVLLSINIECYFYWNTVTFYLVIFDHKIARKVRSFV
jgi:hypothetical protein